MDTRREEEYKMENLWIIAILVVIAIHFFVAYLMDTAAREKGYDNCHAFAISFWLGIPGCLYIVALPDKKLQKQNEEIINLLKGRQEGKKDTANIYDELPEL